MRNLALGLALIMTVSVAIAEEGDPIEVVVERHFASINKGDLEAIMSDYVDDSFLITPMTVVRGKEAIRGIYSRMTKNGTAGVDMKVVTRHVINDVAYAVWTQSNGSQKAAATLVVRNGKIVGQTVVTGIGIPEK